MFRVALAQINQTVGDLSANREKIIEYLGKAEELSVDLVVFPEMALTGYPPEDLLLKRSFVDSVEKELEVIKSRTGEIRAAIGLPLRDEGKLYNAAVLLHKGREIGRCYKSLLPNYGVFDEERYFEPGVRDAVFEIGELKVGINICEDLWFSHGPTDRQAEAGAQIIVNLSSSPFHKGKLAEREAMVSKRAIENNIYILYNNLIGGQDELVFDGGGMVVDPGGEILFKAARFEEELLVADLPLIEREEKRVPLPPKEERGVLSPLDEVYSALVMGLRDYTRKNGFKKALLGLSGGIDSALTAAIAVDALGSENVIGVTMPSVFSSEGSVDDSIKLAENLGIRLETLSIAPAVEAYERTLAPCFEGTERGLAEENIQPRIRGNLLMALSNKFGWLLLATGNKSEVSVGYCTIYGDMAGGYAVIKDVFKTLVYKLARYRNEKAGLPLIPIETIEKPPSAELRPDQKDSDSLPDYPLLDKILKAYVEEDREVAAIEEEVGEGRTVREVIELVDRNEYKRRQAPPGVKITPKAFGRDRRLPITNRYRG